MHSLVLTLSYPARASYYDDWLDGFKNSPDFKADVLNIFPKHASRELQKIIKNYDLIILLHACTSDTLLYANEIKEILQNRSNKVLSFVGNEYNHPSLFLSHKIEFLKSIKVDYIATQLPIDAGSWIYEHCNAQIIEMPHALNPLVFKPIKDFGQRSIDIGMRSYHYPAFLGDNDRNKLFDFFSQIKGFKTDFSQEKRLSREDWAKFLNNSKAVVATEAGSYYLERNDAIVSKIKDYVLSTYKGVIFSSHTPFRRFISSLPYLFKNKLKIFFSNGFIQNEALMFEKLSFDEIYPLFFENTPKCPYHSKAISSRHFDAIGTKTVQIMSEGYYNGILEKDKNYISIKRDLSNIDEVLEIFKDHDFCQKMVNETYDFVIENHTFEHRLKKLYNMVQ